MVDPAILSALFTFGAMVVAIITGWLAQRYRNSQDTKQQRKQERQAIETHVNDKLDAIANRLDEQGEKLDKINEDVVYLKNRVAVHDDRWDRAKAVMSNGHNP